MRETVVTEGQTRTYYAERSLKVVVSHGALIALLAAQLIWVALGHGRHGRQLHGLSEMLSDDLAYHFWLVCMIGLLGSVLFRAMRMPLVSLSPESFEVFRSGRWGSLRGTEIPYSAVLRMDRVQEELGLETKTEGFVKLPLDRLKDEHRNELLDELRLRVESAGRVDGSTL